MVLVSRPWWLSVCVVARDTCWELHNCARAGEGGDGDEAKKQTLLADQVVRKVDDFHTQLAKLETEIIVYEEHQIAKRSTSMGVSASVDSININQQTQNRITSQQVAGKSGVGGSHDDFEINTRQQAASMTQLAQKNDKPTFAHKAIDGTIGRLSRQHSLNPATG